MSPGHVGFAVLFTVSAVLAVWTGVSSWIRQGAVPASDLLFMPTMALMAWRQVDRKQDWSRRGRGRLQFGRVAYLTLLILVVVVGLADLSMNHTRTGMVVFASGLFLIAELASDCLRWLRARRGRST